MRNTLLLITVSMYMQISTCNLNAASLAGVNLPDVTTVGANSLVLNGMGLRTEFMVKVYVAGLYLQQRSSDANAIIKTDAPNRFTMQFLHGASKKQMTDAFDESFKDNTPDAEKTMKTDINRFLNALEDVKVGEQMVFTYMPDTGTMVTIGGQDRITIAGAPFSQVLFSVWLGPKPPTANLKKGILGQ
jgi:hypothetical protein